MQQKSGQNDLLIHPFSCISRISYKQLATATSKLVIERNSDENSNLSADPIDSSIIAQ